MNSFVILFIIVCIIVTIAGINAALKAQKTLNTFKSRKS